MEAMLQWRLNSLIGELRDRTEERYSLRRIAQEAGISYPAIWRISQNEAARVDTETLDKLLRFFSKRLGRRIALDELLRFEE